MTHDEFPIKIAIAGIGGFAEAHHRACLSLEREGIAKVVATCDPSLDNLAFRLGRNFLKGQVGDAINLLLAAAASNLSLWMRQVLLRLVWALRLFQQKCHAQYPLPA